MDEKVNGSQLDCLKDISQGLTEYNDHDRRTLNALHRRKLVRFNARSVALTRKGKKLIEEAN